MAVQQEESTVNIEQIMDEIRADIKRRKLDGTLVPFRDVSQNNVIVNLDVDSDMYDEAKLDKNLDYINKDYMVILDRPFAQGSPKPVDFFFFFVRKVVRFYVNPVV